MKYKVFIASSVEGLDIAYPIQTNLKHDADITVWSQGVFSLSSSSLDSLVNALNGSDFGIFVFSPDDETKMRGDVHETIRDNVLFELGLFLGRLGKMRCFIVMPDNIDLHIPTDLVGVTPATYSGSRDVSEITAALGPACHEIRKSMGTQGFLSESKVLPKIPASEFDSYDDNDKVTILKSWLSNDAEDGVALKFTGIDDKLKLEHGTTKLVLPQIISNVKEYEITDAGSNFFSLAYNPTDSSYF